MSVTKDPFGTHIEKGVYLTPDGTESTDVFDVGHSYLMHKIGGHGHGDDHAPAYHGAGSYPDAVVDDEGFIHRKYKVLEGPEAGQIKAEAFGPKAFGALFFFITGFHGFHVLSGVVFLIIIMLNVASGLYMKRKNGHEMVEKIGLYWHFVDLVWVFVFLVFYLI
jgi:cytochrome c oxidase subunit 3